jgi:hypothetical protein
MSGYYQPRNGGRQQYYDSIRDVNEDLKKGWINKHTAIDICDQLDFDTDRLDDLDDEDEDYDEDTYNDDKYAEAVKYLTALKKSGKKSGWDLPDVEYFDELPTSELIDLALEHGMDVIETNIEEAIKLPKKRLREAWFEDSQYIEEFKRLNSEYVPHEGKSDNVLGEMVRALTRLAYRFWNDGDRYFEGYGTETTGSDEAYLETDCPLSDEFAPILIGMIKGDYENGLSQLLDTLFAHEAEFDAWANEENTKDSRSEYEPAFDGNYDDDEDDYEDEYDPYEYGDDDDDE